MSDSSIKKEKLNNRYCGTFVLLVVLIVSGAIATLVMPKSEFLPIENRKVKSFPAFSVDNILDGSFVSDFDKAIADRIPFREKLIGFKCAVDEVLFQKLEENGILIGSAGEMFTKRFCISDSVERQIEKNVNVLCQLSENIDVPVHFMLIPSASSINDDKLLFKTPQINENQIMDDIFSKASESLVDVIDVRDSFEKNKDKKLYYYTDHHFTLDGALVAYKEYCNKTGIEEYSWYKENKVEIEDFYGTHYAKARPLFTEADTISYYKSFGDADMNIYDIKGSGEYTLREKEKAVNVEKFNEYDKYSAFLNGNNGYSVLEGTGTGAILLVKDSFGNSFAGLLVNDYSKIGIIDYRNYAYGLKDIVEKEGYEQVLILYSFNSFVEDKYFVNVIRQ